MQAYEYKVVPAPNRGEKERGAKTAAERFGVALSNLMNSMAREGWEYQRAETLPCEERVGFTGKATNFQNMLVFRRSLAAPTFADMPDEVPMPALMVGGGDPDGGVLPRLGGATASAGPAPALGPARPELAAE